MRLVHAVFQAFADRSAVAVVKRSPASFYHLNG